MTVSFYSIPTNIGASKLANAIATGVPLNLTEMAVGDGGGVYVEPDPVQTALVNECYRTTINSLTVNADDSQQVVAEMVIPEDIGGFTEREIGIFDEDGDLIIVANCAAIEKAAPDSGSPSSQVIKLPIEISSAAEINLVIDPSAIIVTQEYADNTFLKKENNLSDLTDAAQARTNLELGDAATKNTGTTEGTVAAGDDSRITGALQSGNNLSDLEDAEEARAELGLGSAATHGEDDFLSTSGGQLNGMVNSVADTGFVQSAPWIDVSGDGTNFYNNGWPIWLDGDYQSASYHIRGRVIDQYDWAQWIMTYPGGVQCIEMRSTGELLFNGASILTWPVAAAAFVTATRFGANMTATWPDSGGTVPGGCALTGGNYDDATEYPIYAYMQYCINGVWINASGGYGEELQALEYQSAPESGISQLINLKPYLRETDTLPGLQGVVHYIDDNGYDWFEAAPKLTGSIFIAVDSVSGVILQIANSSNPDTDAYSLYPNGVSVFGLDSLPTGCCIDGSWKYDGEIVFQDADIAAENTLQANTAKLKHLLRACTDAAFPLQSAVALGAATPEQQTLLAELQQYAIALINPEIVDPTASPMTLPTPPAALQR